MVIFPSVKVPVLSLQITEAEPKVSTAASFPRGSARRFHRGGKWKHRGSAHVVRNGGAKRGGSPSVHCFELEKLRERDAGAGLKRSKLRDS